VPRDAAPVAHVATPQWQSFEIRMRARKADRCLQRAAAALDDGSIDEANDALEEARQLSPLDPRLEQLSARLDALKYPAPPPSTVQSRGYFWTSAAVLAGLVVASAAGWETWIHRDTFALLVPKALPDMDANSGLAAPSAVSGLASGPSQPNATSATDTSGAPVASTSSASRDTVVQTTLVRPDQVIDTRVIPTGRQPANEIPRVPTSGSSQPSDTKPDAVNPLAATNAPEPSARPQRDTAPSPPPSPETRSPVALPALPDPSPATSFIPSVAPPTAPSPAPPASRPAASTPPLESAPAPDDRVAIRAALSRYESAYNRLDVDAVRTIWPTLDHRALARAFENLSAQRVALQTCNVDVSGSTARANCSGNASWTPRVGGGERSAARKWTFDLNESNGAWRITHVQAQ
jgi:hypothetical protein